MTVIHIHRPTGHYIGQVRETGHRLWETVTKKNYASPESALKAISAKMHGMKRGRVLFIDDSGYYEPNIVIEVNRA
jgi:hypothetical protein